MKNLALSLLFVPFFAAASASDGNIGGFHIGDSISQQNVDIDAFKKSGLPIPSVDALDTYNGIVLLKPKSEEALEPFKTVQTNLKNGKVFELMAANDALDMKTCHKKLNVLTREMEVHFGPSSEHNTNYAVWNHSLNGLTGVLQCQNGSLLLFVRRAV